MSNETKNIFDVVFFAIQLSAIVAGALWAYFRFWREGTFKPRIEFDLSCIFFHPQNGKRIAHFILYARNKGNIEHKFIRISLKVRGISSGENLILRDDMRVNFSETLIEAELVPKDFGYFFVRPGVEQPITFTTAIGEDISFILVRAAFKYENSKDLHTTERAFDVQATGEHGVGGLLEQLA